MTTVAAKIGELYSDSRETGAVKRNRPKHFRTHDYLVGVAGDCSCLHAVEHLLTWPKRPTVASLTKWMHKHFNAEKLNLFVIDGLYVYEGNGVECIGSGAPWAEGYLRAYPDDLKGAIETACFFDPYTAGPVLGPYTV